MALIFLRILILRLDDWIIEFGHQKYFDVKRLMSYMFNNKNNYSVGKNHAFTSKNHSSL